eukprot:Nk52_evm7s280 gene=Nk52_evmTU7s280
MFLDWVAQLSLLNHDPETNVLGAFPLSVRKTIITAVVKFMEKSSNRQFLSSHSHVNWVMEVVGQGFSLPIQEADTIVSCIELYNEWLQSMFSPNEGIPPCIINNPQKYYRTIFGHYSLLFVPRKDVRNVTNGVGKHVELCRRTLQIIQSVARGCAHDFSSKTWEVLLKILLGICDSLLSRPCATEDMADQLCPELLNVLFDLWLHSSMKSFPNSTMWDALKTLCSHWRHRMPLIEQWNTTTLALTERVLRTLYGENVGKDVIVVADLIGDSTKGNKNSSFAAEGGIQMPSDCAMQCWNRMLHIVGNPNKINDPKIYLVAMKGVAKLADTFLSVGEFGDRSSALSDFYTLTYIPSLAFSSRIKTKGAPRQPSGNSILHIFGQWLFEACGLIDIYAEGRAQAYGSLCRIFSAQQGNDKILPVYLARFYYCITQGINKQDGLALSAIILNSVQLFRLELRGARVLFPHFVTAIARVLPKSSLTFNCPASVSHLRRASILVLMSIFSLPNHFGELLYSPEEDQPLASEHGTPKTPFKPLISKECALSRESFSSYSAPNIAKDVQESNSSPAVNLTSTDDDDDDINGDLEKESAGGGLWESYGGEALKSQLRSTRGRAVSIGTKDESYTPGMPLKSSPVVNKDTHSTSNSVSGSNMVNDRFLMSGAGSFISYKSVLSNLMLDAFMCESDSMNTQLLLHAIAVFMLEDRDHTPQLVSSAVRTIEKQLMKMKWNTDVTLTAFDVLSRLVDHLPLIEQYDQKLAPEVAKSLCRYITEQTNKPTQKHTKDLHSMIGAAYYCLLGWCLKGQWLFHNPGHILLVLEVIELGMTGAKSRRRLVVRDQDNGTSGHTGGGSNNYSNPNNSSGGISGGNINNNSNEVNTSSSIINSSNMRESGVNDARTSALHNDSVFSANMSGISAATVSSYGEDDRANDIGVPKESKLAHPPSKRVKEAAEALLHLIVNNIGNFPPTSGPSRVSTLVTESELIEDLKKEMKRRSMEPEKALEYVRYFALDNSIIIGLIEKPFKSGCPGATVIIRDSYGKFSWETELTYLARAEHELEKELWVSIDQPRPQPSGEDVVATTMATVNTAETMTDKFLLPHAKAYDPVEYQAFEVDNESLLSKSVETISGDAIKSHSMHTIPGISKLSLEGLFGDMQVLQDVFVSHAKLEARMYDKIKAYYGHTRFPDPDTSLELPHEFDRFSGECKFQITRLLLSHLGFFSLSSVTPDVNNYRSRPRFLPLDCNDRMLESLEQLDNLSERVCDTASILYVKKGQQQMEAIDGILRNKIENEDFVEFLHAVGWPVDPKTHRGFNAGLNSTNCNTILYFADVLTEFVFRVPGLITTPTGSLSTSGSKSKLTESPKTPSLVGGSKFSKGLDMSGAYRKRMSISVEASQAVLEKRKSLVEEDKIVIAWLEDFDDYAAFPFRTNGKVTMFVHPLPSGMFRVRIEAPPTWGALLGPLFTGMIISRKVLGPMVRQTALNASRRFRLETDAARPSTLRKKQIEEIINRHKNCLNVANVYSSLLTQNSKNHEVYEMTLTKRGSKIMSGENSAVERHTSSKNPVLVLPKGAKPNLECYDSGDMTETENETAVEDTDCEESSPADN